MPLHRRAAIACLDWLVARARHWQRAREAASNRSALQALDAATLKDIGLDRSEIESWVVCGVKDRRPR